MEISYKRTHKESYMIISTEEYVSDYEEQMLKENEIRSLLSFYTMEMNGRIQFWYDISGKQSLKDYLQQKEVTYESMEEVFLYLAMAYEEIHKYLLHEDKVYLCPETVYVARQGQFRVFLCYCPFENFDENPFAALMEYVLTIVDHGTDDLMRTCYEMYDMTLQDGTTLYDLLHYLQEQMEGMRYIEEKSTIAYEELEIPSYNEDVPPMVEEKERMVPEESVYYESSYEKILQTIRAKGQHIKELILSWFAQNREVHGGKKDVLIEPEPIPVERTVLLHEKAASCQGQLLYQGNGGEEDFFIREKTFRIGTDASGNEAQLHSSAVSHQHARIIRQEREFYIEDLNSTNGTFVNGVMLAYTQKKKLEPMDRVTFADVEYLFV